MTQNHDFFPAIAQLPYLTAVKGPLVAKSLNSLRVKSAHLETLAGTWTIQELSAPTKRREYTHTFLLYRRDRFIHLACSG